mmetsp:Transcript_31814/g.73051  ORF Transcript_31814/g.73051 Transcript_31814/m.73051 type:complete len:500 (-) Transcript_31814:72-1571(-)
MSDAAGADDSAEPDLELRCLDTGTTVGMKEVMGRLTHRLGEASPASIPQSSPSPAMSSPLHRSTGSSFEQDRSTAPSSPKAQPPARKKDVRVHAKNEVGEIVGPSGNRASTLVNSMQLGIRYCVSRTEARASQPKGPGEVVDLFKEKQKVSFPKDGSPLTPKHNLPPFQFKEYMPTVCRNLRKQFDIDAADFLVSLCNTLPDGTNALRIMGTPGKSGSLFFFSHDMRFIVKTLPQSEAKVLKTLMPDYSEFLVKHPKSLLPRYYALYRLSPDFGRAVRLVVMNNIFAARQEVHVRYDLKGSTLGRHAALEGIKESNKDKVVLKDLDLLQGGDKISVGWQAKQELMAQIVIDTEFLTSHNIMDYSLLLGVHYRAKAERQAQGSVPLSPGPGGEEFLVLPGVSRRLSSGSLDLGDLDDVIPVYNLDTAKYVKFAPYVTSQTTVMRDDTSGEKTYFFGIIDTLTTYSVRKSLEMSVKKVGASVLPPPKYSERFVKFLDSVIE